MSTESQMEPSVRVVRIMALLCVLLALMCAGLAWAWTEARASAACWRTAAEFQLPPEGACGE